MLCASHSPVDEVEANHRRWYYERGGGWFPARICWTGRETGQPGSYYIQWYFHTCGFICQILINRKHNSTLVRQRNRDNTNRRRARARGVLCAFLHRSPPSYLSIPYLSSFGSKDEKSDHKKNAYFLWRSRAHYWSISQREDSLIITKHLMCINNFLVSSGRQEPERETAAATHKRSIACNQIILIRSHLNRLRALKS